MLSRQCDDGYITAYTKKNLLSKNEVAVLGMRQKFECAAQNKFSEALSAYIEPAIDTIFISPFVVHD
jgi:hypothetical protein